MPTIKEVADLAGVSVGTVSHVVTRSVRVSERLRNKVENAIRKLDYHPNHVARSLKTSRTRTLGIVIPDMTISFFPRVLQGAEAFARENGYALIAVNSADSAERQGELLSLLRSQQVEGILLVVSAEPTPPSQITKMADAGLPIVCVDRIPDKITIDSVSAEDVSAAEMGVNHLLQNGYRRIAIVTGPLSLRNEQLRLKGYEACMKKAGIKEFTGLVWQGNLLPEDIEQMCNARLADPANRPDALFCTNGPTALGALRGMRRCGLHTPEDLGFATFDDLAQVEDIFRPGITTVVQPAYEMGFRAAEILLQRIEQGKDRLDKTYTVRLPATLTVRESSQGPARARKVRGAD